MFKSLGIAGNSRLGMIFFHQSYDTARIDFKNYIDTVFDISPYFRRPFHKPPVRFIPSGPTTGSQMIGVNILVGILSEVGHWKPKDGIARSSELVTRFDSRFANKKFTWGALVCDSSAKDENNEAVTKFESLVPPEELIRIKAAQWECRPELYESSNGKTFKFYIGDTIRGPMVIDGEDDIIKLELDQDRIIDVPVSAKYKFLEDPVRNLRDLAGISYSGNEKFFNGNISHLINCSTLKNYSPEEIIVDFFDKEDSIYSHVENMIYRIPRGTSLYVHYDIGLKKDKTGIALCYYDGEKQVGEYTLPKFKIPLAFVVSRKKGQATSLDHLYQFLQDLVKNGYIVEFSADSFASAGILQNAERDGIPYRPLSVDKTMEAYNVFKNIVNSERLELPYINILLRECSELLVTYNGVNGEHCKVDHPLVSSCYEFDHAGMEGNKLMGSKDLADAISGALFNCYYHYSKYQELGMTGGVSKTLQSFTSQTSSALEETQKIFQGMLNNLF